MGGKHKQAQRTKNNVRPSSSGRSAELLGNSAPSFVGFTAVKDGGFVPVLPGFSVTTAEELDPNLNPNFHLVLKKMGKKDSTTKLKALQEFSELIRNSEPEAVKAVLPLWPRLYCHLAVDVEHRVREAAHQAQRAVVLRAKRNLAPYLRQLAGPWFTSQYDTYPPAATAACLAFQDAFPPNKVIEAIVFCQEEILNYIYDNLIVQTAQTLSNPKVVTTEEMEAKYQRVVVSSLQGYALYLLKLPAEQLEIAHQANKKLITSKKFWKFSKHTSALIRNAWFSALSALCQEAPDLLVDEGAHVALAVFGNLDETDPSVLPTVWEASLHVLTTVEDCWQHVSAEKLVLPKLWRILCEGGQGNAATIFPNLLPFLSKIPSAVCSDKQTFYDKFFNNMLEGFSQKSVIQSSSESNAVAKSYIECLRYIVMLHLSDAEFCQTLIQNHLLAAIKLMLKDQKLQLVSTALFSQVSGLVYHWSRNCNNEEYATLAQLFWEYLTLALVESLVPIHDGDTHEQTSITSDCLLNRHVNLCLCLKDPKRQRSNQRLKVKFSSSEDNSEEGSSEPDSPTDSISENICDIDQGLQSVVQVLSASYLRKIIEFGDPVYLTSLAGLVRTFESRDLFVNLLNTVGERRTESNDSLVEIYDSLLNKWLHDEHRCCKELVDITFALLKFLTTEEKTHVLDSLCKISNKSVLVWCVKAALDCQSDSSVQNWLQSSQLSQILISLAHDICCSKSSIEAQHIIKCCVGKTKNGELVISPAAFSDILYEFSQSLHSSDKEPICLDFVTELVVSLYSGDLMLSPFLHSNLAAEELLLSLFRASCQNKIRLKNEVTAWHIAISALARLHGSCSEDFLKLSFKFAESVKDELLKRNDISVGSIDHIMNTVLSFINAAVKCFPTELQDQISCVSATVTLCSVFLNCFSSTLAHRENNLTAICLYAEQVKGLLNLNLTHSIAPCDNDDKNIKLKELTRHAHSYSTDEGNIDTEINQYVISLLYVITLISKLPDIWNLPKDEVNCDSDEEKEAERITFSNNDVGVLESHLLTAIYSIAVCESFTRHYKSSVYYYKIFSKYSILKERFKQLMRYFDAETMELVIQAASDRARQHGSLWLQAVYLLHSAILKRTDLNELYMNLTSSTGVDTVGTVEISQVFPLCLKVEDMRVDMTTLNVDKLIMVACWLNQLENNVPLDYVDSVRNILDSVLIWYQHDDKTELLFDCSKVKWPQAKAVAAAARFLAAVVEKCPELLSADHWDAIIICLASWMLSVKNSQNLLFLTSEHGSLPLVLPSDQKLQIVSKSSESGLKSAILEPTKTIKAISINDHSGPVFALAVFQLLKALTGFFAKSREDFDDDALKKFHEKLNLEWKDVFAVDIYEVIISTFKSLADLVEKCSLSLLDLPLLESVGTAVLQIAPSYFDSFDTASNSLTLDAVVECCCKLVHSSAIPLQLTAYHLLNKLAYKLIELDTPAAFAAAAADKEGDGLSLKKLKDTLQQTQTVVDTMLLGIRLGNSCTVQPFTDAYTYTTAYFLLWATVLEMCGLAVSELRYQYATMLRESGFLKSLLHNIFRLLPDQVLQATDPKCKVQRTTEMFASPPLLEFSQASSSEMLEHMACWIYCNSLRRLPALVRQWWNDTEPRISNLVEYVTSTHCSPLLCAEEMKAIQGKDMHHGNMLVKVHPGVREVVAVYKVDEVRMELNIQLPNNYPLSPVRVISGKQVVDTGRWRNSMMQLTVFLTHQNGSIWDGLALWKSNLDKRFEGVEECYICFSILHGSNFQIPQQTCSTCKKKFHSSCLYKWFNTSNKATCPICRNLF